jgi:hypothetical protein
MNRFFARMWLPVMPALLLSAAGCSDSPAPAMTQSSQSVIGPAADDAVPAKPGSETSSSVSSSAEQKAKPAEASNRIRDISFDDLKFDINKGDPFIRSLLTDKIEALDGKRVRIRGYILPSFQQTGLTQFVLVRDNLSCCFGPGAAIYDCVIVEMKPGRSTDYSLYPVAVDGVFTIHELLDPDGKTVAIYHLDGEQVR